MSEEEGQTRLILSILHQMTRIRGAYAGDGDRRAARAPRADGHRDLPGGCRGAHRHQVVPDERLKRLELSLHCKLGNPNELHLMR